jgi:DNA-directed RNA polymerase specialized sigma24 family protein
MMRVFDTREIVERLLQGKARLLTFLEGRLGHRADAEDVLQQALLVLVEKRQSLRRGESIVAWFHTVLRNLVVDALRRRQARMLAARLTAEVSAACGRYCALCRGLRLRSRRHDDDAPRVRGDPAANRSG